MHLKFISGNEKLFNNNFTFTHQNVHVFFYVFDKIKQEVKNQQDILLQTIPMKNLD